MQKNDKYSVIKLNVKYFLKWGILGVLIGIIGGLIGTYFALSISLVTKIRLAHAEIIWFLPFAGLIIVAIYHLVNQYHDEGTNEIIAAITAEGKVSLWKVPLVIIATIITHLFGGSSGREGAALQIGGSLGQNLGRYLKLDIGSQKILVMCGMSACFSALFGTPLAATFLGMEISSIGIMYYAAFLPNVIAALTANAISEMLGGHADVFNVNNIPGLDLKYVFLTIALSLVCAILSIIFCVCLHKGHYFFSTKIKNPYLRIFIAGLIIAICSWLLKDNRYNGAGMYVVEEAFMGKVVLYSFFIKLIFTTITMSAGYKGGEIVPALYIGATFGAAVAAIFHLNFPICTAIGMASLFCGVTNCPISALFLCFEMFGYDGMPYYLMAISISFAFSGYFSLYHRQKIVYSKYYNKYINQSTI